MFRYTEIIHMFYDIETFVAAESAILIQVVWKTDGFYVAPVDGSRLEGYQYLYGHR